MDYRLLVPSKNKIVTDILDQLIETKEVRIFDHGRKISVSKHLSDLRKEKLVDFYRGNGLLIKAPEGLTILKTKKNRWSFDYVFTINHDLIGKL